MHIYSDIKTNNSIERNERKRALISDIHAVKLDIDAAQRNFDCVCDPAEVDIYVYRLRTAHAQYDALLKKLKELS